MAYPTLGQFSTPGYANTFIPGYAGDGESQKQFIVGWTLNEEAFAFNAYVTVVGADKPVFYYRKYKSEDFVRVSASDQAMRTWADGADMPKTPAGARFTNLLVELRRWGEHDFIGDMSEDYSDIGSQIPLLQKTLASRAMVQRAIDVQAALTTSGEYPSTGTTHYYAKWGVLANDSTIVGSGQTYPTGYFGTAGTNTAYDGTLDDPLFAKMLNHMMGIIQRRTNSQVQPKDLALVLNPNTAARLAKSREVRAYLAQNAGSLAVIQGKTPTYNGMMYGLPDPFHGLKVVVDGTTKTTARHDHVNDDAQVYVVADNQISIVARPGAVSGIPGSRSYGSLVVWQDKKRAMKPKTEPDAFNERVKVGLQDMYAVRLVAPEATATIADISAAATS